MAPPILKKRREKTAPPIPAKLATKDRQVPLRVRGHMKTQKGRR